MARCRVDVPERAALGDGGKTATTVWASLHTTHATHISVMAILERR